MNADQLIPFVCTRPVDDPGITCSEPVALYTQWMSPHSFFLVAVGALVLDPSAQTLYVFVRGQRYELPHTQRISLHLIDNGTSMPYTYRIEYCFLQCGNELLPKPAKRTYLYETLADLEPLLSVIAERSETTEQYLFDAIDRDLFCKSTTARQQALILGDTVIDQVPSQGPRQPAPVATGPWTSEHLLAYDPACTIEACRRDTTPNRWTALVVNTTHTEADSGRLERFLERLVASVTAPVSKALYVCLNRPTPFSERVTALLQTCKSLFINVDVLIWNIPEEEDLYVREESATLEGPPLGNVSGPNTSFFRTMRAMIHHNTVLCLETDCFFRRNWIPVCDAYVTHGGRFLVAGALYDGKLMWSRGTFLRHLNGVGFFKTGSSLFQTFLDKVDLYIRRQVQNGNRTIAYDAALTDTVDAYITAYMDATKGHTQHNHCCAMFCFWRYVHRLLVHTTHIVNASVKEDKDLSLDLLDNLYKYAILHKKDAPYEGVLFSFSLYGAATIYTRGMVANCERIKARFPGARVYVYCADDVPPTVVDVLRSHTHVTVIPVVAKPGIEGMFDRFLACDDPGATHVFVRDADSRVHERDAACIDDFLGLRKDLHIIRDHPLHTRRIMGGMFGVRRGAVSVKDLLHAWTRQRTAYGADQDFLSERLYSALKGSAVIHDRCHTFSDETVTPFRHPIEGPLFVGQVHVFKDGQEHTKFTVTPLQ